MKFIYCKIKYIFLLYLFKKKWRFYFKNTQTIPVNLFPFRLVKIGKYTYGPIKIEYWGSEREGLEIGNFVSIANGVKFILGGNHEINTFTTYPFKVIFWGEDVEALTKGKIIVKDDVWIGMDAMIMSGVTIGQGAIIAARSVVTKDVPAYAVVGGNPSKIIKYRFSSSLIEKMIKFNWENVDISKIEKLKTRLYEPLDEEVYYEIIKELEVK